MQGVCNLDPARLGPASAEAWNTLDMGLQPRLPEFVGIFRGRAERMRW
jgi:hypothetical protein